MIPSELMFDRFRERGYRKSRAIEVPNLAHREDV